MARLFDDALSEYIQEATAPVTESDVPFAVVCWFRTDHVNGQEAILSLSDASLGTRQYFLAIHDSASPGGSGDDLSATERESGGGVAPSAFATSAISANTWHHAAGIFVSTTDRRCLLDGGNKGTNTTTGGATGIDVFDIGRLGDLTPNWYWSGDVAEVAIWKLTDWPGAAAADKANNFEAIIPALAKGYSPAHWPLGLAYYAPLVRSTLDRINGVSADTVSGTSVSSHPPIFSPVGLSMPAPVPDTGLPKVLNVQSNNESLTLNYTPASGTNTVLVVAITQEDVGNDNDVTAVSFDGGGSKSLTKAVDAEHVVSTNTQSAELWYYAGDPGTTNGNITVTGAQTDRTAIFACTLTNIDRTNPLGGTPITDVHEGFTTAGTLRYCETDWTPNVDRWIAVSTACHDNPAADWTPRNAVLHATESDATSPTMTGWLFSRNGTGGTARKMRLEGTTTPLGRAAMATAVFVQATAGAPAATPKGPLGHPLHGALFGPIGP